MANLVDIKFSMFFDRVGVTSAIEAKNNRVLARTGAFGRTVMKRGMRKRKGISPPGGYPYSHAGQLRDLIFFAKDNDSVVIGPLLFGSQAGKVAGKTVPQLLNEGGMIHGGSYLLPLKKGQQRRRRVFSTVWKYRPRPFVDLSMPATLKAFRENMRNEALKD